MWQYGPAIFTGLSVGLVGMALPWRSYPLVLTMLFTSLWLSCYLQWRAARDVSVLHAVCRIPVSFHSSVICPEPGAL